MTRKAIATMIAGVGLPYAYDHFEETEAPGAPPFICFLYPDSAGFHADNVNYAPVERLVIELYTDTIDFAKEEAVLAALNSAGLSCSYSREWIESERMYQTTFTTEVLINVPDREQSQVRP